MKKFLLFILILVAVAGVCVVTCPDKASHSEALKDVLNTAITEELSSSDDRAGANDINETKSPEFIGTNKNFFTCIIFSGIISDSNFRANLTYCTKKVTDYKKYDNFTTD